MIQRKQSIFILVAMLLVGYLMLWPIDIFAGPQGMIELTWTGLWDVTPGVQDPHLRSLTALSFLIVLELILNFLGLFMYRHRSAQLRVIGVGAGLAIGISAVLVYLGVSTAGQLELEWHFCAKWLVPIAVAVLDILAYRFISDDEALVRSLNRLR